MANGADDSFSAIYSNDEEREQQKQILRRYEQQKSDHEYAQRLQREENVRVAQVPPRVPNQRRVPIRGRAIPDHILVRSVVDANRPAVVIVESETDSSSGDEGESDSEESDESTIDLGSDTTEISIAELEEADADVEQEDGDVEMLTDEEVDDEDEDEEFDDEDDDDDDMEEQIAVRGQRLLDEDRNMFQGELELHSEDDDIVSDLDESLLHPNHRPVVTEYECTICFEKAVDPVGCLYCLQILGCRKCSIRWFAMAKRNGKAHCPLCRSDWGASAEVLPMDQIMATKLSNART